MLDKPDLSHSVHWNIVYSQQAYHDAAIPYKDHVCQKGFRDGLAFSYHNTRPNHTNYLYNQWDPVLFVTFLRLDTTSDILRSEISFLLPAVHY